MSHGRSIVLRFQDLFVSRIDMEPSVAGSFRLFRAAGINVYLHWTWFVVAYLMISRDNPHYDTTGGHLWKVAEYLSLFGIVLMHEFGHALACRQVGGTAERIMLWPLGGIAYVSPPARPGAVLWSIVAGPLVNFALLAPTIALWVWAYSAGWPSDVSTFVWTIMVINIGLLVFNLLPIYPLDGGQILHALLWYGVGRWPSLQAVSIVGGIFGALMLLGSMLLAPIMGWGVALLGLIAVFIGLRSVMAYQVARYMIQLERLPRHRECACPSCHANPPSGPFWLCEHCATRFDTFTTRGKCPACGAWYLDTTCPHCRARHHIDRWFEGQPAEEVLDPIVLSGPPEHSAPQTPE
jgi:Zn-dependent protease